MHDLFIAVSEGTRFHCNGESVYFLSVHSTVRYHTSVYQFLSLNLYAVSFIVMFLIL